MSSFQKRSKQPADPVEVAFVEFNEAWFSGDPPDPAAFCRENPECGAELQQRIDIFLEVVEGLGEMGSKVPGPAPDKKKEAPGTIVGDFKIVCKIGRGGMGIVYEAEQLSLKRPVALKVLPLHLGLSEGAVQRFHREAEAGGRQTHSGIVAVYSVGEADGMHYIAQELVPGGRTLADAIEELREDKRLSTDYFHDVATLFASISDSLEYAHSSRVIHRDLKPSNILLTAAGEPKVTDFGLAKVEDALALSQSGEFVGTPYYMSPEQASSSRMGIDHRTDVFSLGVTLYETLALERPFRGEATHEILQQILFEEPKDPRAISAGIPRDLVVICFKAMEKNPDHRYQTMAEFAADLRRFLAGEPIRAKTTGLGRRVQKWVRRHKLTSFAAIASLLALTALTILALFVAEKRREHRLDLEGRFVPLGEAMDFDYSEFVTHVQQYQVCGDIAPYDPCGDLLQALVKIELGDLNRASHLFQKCIDKCTRPCDVDLKADAHYVHGLILFAMAEEAESPVEREDIAERARADLNKVGPFDPASPKALVWRHESISATQPRAKNILREIRLNEDHPLIHLYLGLSEYVDLYKGGDLKNFENAFEHFEKASNGIHGKEIALTCLGRTYFFLARFYNLLDMTDRAHEFLDRAYEITKTMGTENHMIHIALGQNHLLRGELDLALKHLDKALAVDKTRKSRTIHNALAGIAVITARRESFRDPIDIFAESLAVNRGDPHINVAISEYYLQRGDLEKALEHADKGLHLHNFKGERTGVETQLASAYLLSARILLGRDNIKDALNTLCDMDARATCSPRDLSLACMIVPALPEEELESSNTVPSPWVSLASNLARKAVYHGRFGERISPICLAAEGVSRFLNGDYEGAIHSLEQAMTERKERWPEKLREFYWTDDVRELYLLSMVHSKLARGNEDNKIDHMEKGAAFFQKAEDLWSRNSDRFIDYRDILEALRLKARVALGDR